MERNYFKAPAKSIEASVLPHIIYNELIILTFRVGHQIAGFELHID